ncbi:MAG: hemerythrin domain-containing protein [Pseudomonadota bacterium]
MPASAKAKSSPVEQPQRKPGKRGGNSKKSRNNNKISPGGDKLPEQPLMVALRAEHRHMANILELYRQQLESIAEGDLVDTHVVYEIMHYMVTWPDRFHHPREDLIYGRVAEIDASAADDVDTLQRDHDRMGRDSRRLLRAIEDWRDGSVDGAEIVELGLAYVEDYYRHMKVEEQLVFPQIEALLSLEDWRDLADEDLLKPVRDPVFGGRVDREFRNLARKLRRGLRHRVEHGVLNEWAGIDAMMESLEVMSMAAESARDSASDHLRAVVDDSLDLFRAAPVSAPLRCAVNNTRHTVSFLGDIFDISRDTMDDLGRVNQERKARVRLLARR